MSARGRRRPLLRFVAFGAPDLVVDPLHCRVGRRDRAHWRDDGACRCDEDAAERAIAAGLLRADQA